MTTVQELMHCQVHDPGKGSYLVHPMPVKTTNGTVKTYRCSDGKKRIVYRAPHVRIYNRRTGMSSFSPREDSIDFVVMDQTVRY